MTAKHCLRDKEPDEVRIQRHPDSRGFVTLVARFAQDPRSLHSEDPDCDDWAVFQVSEHFGDADEDLVRALDLDAIPDAAFPSTTRQQFVVRGYPKKICGIDFENCSIRWQAFAATATYHEKPSWSDFCHTLKLDDVTGVESIDGLSGSPVFIVDTGTRPSIYSFAGMVLRGSKTSFSGHFRVIQSRSLERSRPKRAGSLAWV